MVHKWFILSALAVLLLAAGVFANDGNPCRHISVYDPYLQGQAVFDLSSLIDAAPIQVNQTWDGIDWQIWTFGVCKPLSQACPNTEEGGRSVCAAAGKAAMCQRYTDPNRHREGSFCVSTWNGTIEASLDGDGYRGIHIMLQPGDQREEFRGPTNMALNIECDPQVTGTPTDVHVQPPYFDSTVYTVFFSHKAGCPVNIPHSPQAQPGQPHATPSPHKSGSGMPNSIIALITIGMLLIGLFAGAFAGIWLNTKFGWWGDQRPAAAYAQFELDDDI